MRGELTSHSSSEQHSVGQPVEVGLCVVVVVMVVVGALVVVVGVVVVVAGVVVVVGGSVVTGLVVVLGLVVGVVCVVRVVVIVVPVVVVVKTQDPSIQTPPLIKAVSGVGWDLRVGAHRTVRLTAAVGSAGIVIGAVHLVWPVTHRAQGVLVPSTNRLIQ